MILWQVFFVKDTQKRTQTVKLSVSSRNTGISTIRPLIEHLNDFKASLRNKGATEKHACLVYNRGKAVIENCGFAFIADFSASKVQRYLAERRRDGLSIRSSNFYLQAVKQFCRWLVADNRTNENPLAYLSDSMPSVTVLAAYSKHRRDEYVAFALRYSQAVSNAKG